MERELSARARTHLRRKLRSHPEIKKHVAKLTDIASLKKDELISLAEKCGIDLEEALVKEATIQFIEENYDGMDRERMLHSAEHPAFKGSLELEISINIIGFVVPRLLRVEYSSTPDWEYFDLLKRELYVGWESASTRLQIQGMVEAEGYETTPSGRWRKKRAQIVWYDANVLFDDGVLPLRVSDAIDAAIDEACQQEDRRRREEHGLPVPVYRPYFERYAPRDIPTGVKA